MVHVFQNRLCGRWTPTWFAEGIAEYLGGSINNQIVRTICGHPITNLSQLNNWRNEGHKNPLSINSWNDYPEPREETFWKYYRMFRLTITYLIDEKSLDKSPDNIKLIFTDLKNANNADFNSVFENRFGISYTYYKDNFYQIMEGYLKIPWWEKGLSSPVRLF